MHSSRERIPLFTPHIPESAKNRVAKTLETRWIGQGPQVNEFEELFSEMFCNSNPGIAVGSGTDALHLSYLLAGIKTGDEVISPVFTCTATNIPLLYLGARIVFADIDPRTLNIDPNHIRKIITKKTKAIICVHYGGLPCDMDEISSIAAEYGIPVIEDAAHAVGAKFNGKTIGSISDFTMFSFQAIKHITTGDGGYLTFQDVDLYEKALRLRWFGIDRRGKEKGIWENDIEDIGYKYQMTDISAAMGLGALEVFDETLRHRRGLYQRYKENLSGLSNIVILDDENNLKNHAAWMFTIAVDRRKDLERKLLDNNIESGQVHYRNDRYKIFKEFRGDFPNMDIMEQKYLVLPLHTKMDVSDVDFICEVVRNGW